MTKTGLVPRGERPSFSHSSQEDWEMVRQANNFGLDWQTELLKVMIESRALGKYS